jgi:hypothetical protein
LLNKLITIALFGKLKMTLANNITVSRNILEYNFEN